ncbi:MAG: hypothetical protein IH859_02820 [Chloroflexi bacterium]|nr:hypothetical protein [Chloroflexota bacterium]
MRAPENFPSGEFDRPDIAPEHPYYDQNFYNSIPETYKHLGLFFSGNVLESLAHHGENLSPTDVLRDFNDYKQGFIDRHEYSAEKLKDFTLWHVLLEAQYEADSFQHWGQSVDELSQAAVKLTVDRDVTAQLISDAMDLSGLRPTLPSMPFSLS